MAQEITVPRLGWSMEEGAFAEWLKKPGEFVRAGDMLFVLEGEKATQEIESFDSGFLCIPPDAPTAGDTVQVGQVIGFLLAEGEVSPTSVRAFSAGTSTPSRTAPASESAESLASPPKAEPPHRASAKNSLRKTSPPNHVTQAPTRVAGPAARRKARELGVDVAAVLTPDPTGRVRSEDLHRAAVAGRNRGRVSDSRVVATPRARRRAIELGVDWTQLDGTGRHGRIRERDVLAAIEVNAARRASAGAEPAPAAAGRRVPATRTRLVIARRMLAGVQQMAPVTLTTKLDASSLVEDRERYRADSSTGVLPSYNDILVKHVAATLRQHPELNACWFQDGIWHFEPVNIAVAVDVDAGLVAPVIYDADQLTAVEIAERSRSLAEQARSGTLTPQQLSGGTFTVSNLGMFGIDGFTPILSQHQAGVLGIGRIVDEPVVRDGRLQAGRTITLSLTFDHRVLDGAPAARWLQHLVSRITSSPRE